MDSPQQSYKVGTTSILALFRGTQKFKELTLYQRAGKQWRWGLNLGLCSLVVESRHSSGVALLSPSALA